MPPTTEWNTAASVQNQPVIVSGYGLEPSRRKPALAVRLDIGVAHAPTWASPQPNDSGDWALLLERTD
jgi:hypothetical protein